MCELKKMPAISFEEVENAINSISETGELVSMTSGDSMHPMLRQHKDLVVIEPVNRELLKYDVPLYRRDNHNKLVLHRILKVRENDYVIRGDNTYSLEFVPKDYVVGVLKEFYRNGKYIKCDNKFYKLYVRLNMLFYPVRYFYKIILKPILSKIKRKILNKK